MKDTKDFYNVTAKDWADKGYKDEAMLPYLREFVSYLPESPRILDLCCGAGYESMRMKSLGALVTGVDFSDESIAIAKERNPDIYFVVEDILNDYSYLGNFDGCAIIAGLVHIPNDKLSCAFDRIYEVLEDRGYLFIVVKDGTGKSEKSSFTRIDGEEYDRDFYLHTKEESVYYSKGRFSFVKEMIYEEDTLWKHYIFQKV